MKPYSHPERRGAPRISGAIVAALACHLGTALGQTFTVQADLAGTLIYPDAGPGSVGNENQVSFSNGSGLVSGLLATTSLAESRTGIDANGITGTTAFNGSSSAQPGWLQTTTSVNATATPTGLAPFLHGWASLGSAGTTARFTDQITFGNALAAPGAVLQVKIVFEMGWSHSLSGPAGNFDATALTAGNFGIALVGNVSAQAFEQATGGVQGKVAESLTVSVQNGTTYDLSGQLVVTSGAGLKGVGTAGVSSSTAATSSTLAHFRIEPVTVGTTGSSASGFDYLAVPEPGETAVVTALGALGWAGIRARGRRNPTV